MSQDGMPYTNGTDPDARWQAQIAVMARALPYPPTPNLAAAWRSEVRARQRLAAAMAPRRTLAYALAAVLVLLAALLAIPSVRAGVLEFLQIGSVRIFLVSPTPAPTTTLPAATGSAPAGTRTPRPSATPTPTPLLSVLDLAGQTTFEQAQARVPFELRLPAYPADLGAPDAAFVQNMDGPAAILVWLVPGDPSRVRLVLQFLTSTAIAEKMLNQGAASTPNSVEATRVNGQAAVWVSGPYVLRTRSGEYQEYRLIQGHVLIWTDGTLTYRLETDLTREEAVRVAESLGQ